MVIAWLFGDLTSTLAHVILIQKFSFENLPLDHLKYTKNQATILAYLCSSENETNSMPTKVF